MIPLYPTRSLLGLDSRVRHLPADVQVSMDHPRYIRLRLSITAMRRMEMRLYGNEMMT
jgi:hypothetical protein